MMSAILAVAGTICLSIVAAGGAVIEEIDWNPRKKTHDKGRVVVITCLFAALAAMLFFAAGRVSA